MRAVLVTGMSGTGKSTALAELARQGFDVAETDVPPWSEWSEAAGGYVWCEQRVRDLLARPRPTTLYVAGTVSNQGRFYSEFDAVVLLRAPEEIILSRIASRTTNAFGKTGDQRQRIIDDLIEVEPFLRATCTHELDASRPLNEVVSRLVAIGTGAA